MPTPPLRNVLVTGGAGNVGTRLVPQLLAAGHSVTVYDAMFFGCELTPQSRLKLVEGDIRDTIKVRQNLWDVDAVPHLACISNDPSFELNEGLSKTINLDCFEPLVGWRDAPLWTAETIAQATDIWFRVLSSEAQT